LSNINVAGGNQHITNSKRGATRGRLGGGVREVQRGEKEGGGREGEGGGVTRAGGPEG